MLRLVLVSCLASLALAKGPGKMWDSDCGSSWAGGPDTAFPEGGFSGKQRVVGGWEAQPNSAPWMVSLGYNGGHFCGAAVVNSRHIITAAHCTDGDSASRLTVRVGAHNRRQSTDYDVVYRVSQNIVHPSYDLTGNLENDIAVLVTTEDIAFTSGYVGSICAPRDNDYDADYYAGRPCFTSGWGTTSSGGTSSQVLLYTNIEVTTFQKCKDTHPRGWVVDGMLCAGRPDNGYDRDACQGDSGGPLFLYDQGSYVLIGQVSWGIGCAGQTPGVYADTAYYMDWLDGIIN